MINSIKTGNKLTKLEDKNQIKVKTFDFAVRIVKLYKHIIQVKKEFILTKQLLRCGTSIGAKIKLKIIVSV